MERALLFSLVFMTLLRLSKNGDGLQLPHTEVPVHREANRTDQDHSGQEDVEET
jgi:hypothetical protein